MTLLELMEQPAGTDYVAIVARYFLARPNQWIDARDLMQVAGICGWRTRVSNARKKYGMNITNQNKWIDPYHDWTNANRTRPRAIGIKVGYNFN